MSAPDATHLSTIEVTQPYPESTIRQLAPRPVLRPPEQLRLHPALHEIGWTGSVEEFDQVARLGDGHLLGPILITTSGIVLVGFGVLRLAILENKPEVLCIEYALTDDDALQFTITNHHTQRGWNDFLRIRLALRQKPAFLERAIENMRAGGRLKGSTNLSKAHRIDVRREIAKVAGTGTGNVSRVERILQKAHQNIIAALQNGALKINRAWEWCELPKSEQIEAFALFEEQRTRQKLQCDISTAKWGPFVDPLKVIESLQREVAARPDSIRIRTTCSAHTEIRIGRDWKAKLSARNEDRIA